MSKITVVSFGQMGSAVIEGFMNKGVKFVNSVILTIDEIKKCMS